MVISVDTNADMPVCLSTELKQAKKTKQIRTISFRYPRAEGPRTDNPGVLQQNYASYVTGQ